jgi:hypothetical protein
MCHSKRKERRRGACYRGQYVSVCGVRQLSCWIWKSHAVYRIQTRSLIVTQRFSNWGPRFVYSFCHRVSEKSGITDIFLYLSYSMHIYQHSVVIFHCMFADNTALWILVKYLNWRSCKLLQFGAGDKLHGFHHVNQRLNSKKRAIPVNRPCGPIDLWDVKDPTLSRQSAHS